jgi:G:T/U-mismatch repair DNA glycosylase
MKRKEDDHGLKWKPDNSNTGYVSGRFYISRCNKLWRLYDYGEGRNRDSGQTVNERLDDFHNAQEIGVYPTLRAAKREASSYRAFIWMMEDFGGIPVPTIIPDE